MFGLCEGEVYSLMLRTDTQRPISHEQHMTYICILSIELSDYMFID